MNDELLTMEEAARKLGFSKKNGYKTIQRYIKQGKLPCVRIGRNVRIRPQDLQYFIENRIERGKA